MLHSKASPKQLTNNAIENPSKDEKKKDTAAKETKEPVAAK